MLSRHQILSWVLSWSFESESGHLPWNQGRSVNTYGPLNFMCSWWTEVKLLSRVQLFAIPWTVANGAPPSMGFSRQEYWSGLPFPSPGELPDPGIEPGSPALQADALLSEPQGKPSWWKDQTSCTKLCHHVPMLSSLEDSGSEKLSLHWAACDS